MKKILLLCCFIAVMFGCAKDPIVEDPVVDPPVPKVLQIVEPLPYYPVYPGSWWKYKRFTKRYEVDTANLQLVLAGIDTIYYTVSVSPEYMPHSYKTFPAFDGTTYTTRYSDTVLVPFVNGKPIYQYCRVDRASQLSTPYFEELYPFLSEQVGVTLISSYGDPKFIYLGPYMQIMEKTIDNQKDSIIRVRGTYYGSFMMGREELLTYKKDVGMVSCYIYYPNRNDTISGDILLDYEIKSRHAAHGVKRMRIRELANL
jgi:hypothetical protein